MTHRMYLRLNHAHSFFTFKFYSLTIPFMYVILITPHCPLLSLPSPHWMPSSFCQSPSYFFFFFLDSLNLIRIVCMSMVQRLFTRAWAFYKWPYHQRQWLPLLQDPLTINGSSGNNGALMPLLCPWWNVDGPSLELVSETLAAVIPGMQLTQRHHLTASLPILSFLLPFWPLLHDAEEVVLLSDSVGILVCVCTHYRIHTRTKLPNIQVSKGFPAGEQ